MKKTLFVVVCALLILQTVAIVHYRAVAFRERQSSIEANRSADSMLRLVEWSQMGNGFLRSNYDALKRSWQVQRAILDELKADSNFWVLWTNFPTLNLNQGTEASEK